MELSYKNKFNFCTHKPIKKNNRRAACQVETFDSQKVDKDKGCNIFCIADAQGASVFFGMIFKENEN